MSSTNTSKTLDVAIVGGGIAGLCLAVGLLNQKHISVTVYESAHHFGEIGAGVFFQPNAVRAMEGIDPAIREGFERVATTNQWDELKSVWFDFRFGEGPKAGELFHRQQVDSKVMDGEHAGVHRAKFLEELIKLVPEGVAHFGKRVTEMKVVEDGKIQLTFKDGTSATHGCVIGCDGIHSSTRRYVLGPSDPNVDAVFSGKYCHRGLAPMSQAIEALGEEKALNSQFYSGRHAHLLTFPVDQGKTFNAVAFSSCETWDNDKWVVPSEFKDIREDFKNFGEPVQKIVDLMQDTDIWALFDHPPARTFYKGNVAIIGDAAHATTPHQGSGAGMAIEDAYVLSSLLAKVQSSAQIETCLEAYNAVRLERGHRLVTTSREAGQLWEMEHPKAGDDPVKIGKLASGRFAWIWDEDLDAEIAEALKTMGS